MVTTEEQRARGRVAMKALTDALTMSSRVAPDQAKRARDLEFEREELQRELWNARKAANRHGIPGMMPTDLVDSVKAWNQRVLVLADECLPEEEASSLRGVGILIGGPFTSADQLQDLLDDSRFALQKIATAHPGGAP
jgi:hypothetical protein